MTVSIQGYPGSFHSIAAREFFESDISFLHRDTFGQVFRDTAEGRTERGMVAFENSLTGSIAENYDHLHRTRTYIVGEHLLRIRQFLIGLSGETIENLHTVRSHRVALDQCQRFFAAYPHIKLEIVGDTARSVAEIKAQGLTGVAGVGSREAAEIFGMEVLADNIADYAQNYTRFHAISATPDYPRDADKCTISFGVRHAPGTLLAALSAFEQEAINLCKIESRPVPGLPWQYRFFADLEASASDHRTLAALSILSRETTECQILGSYKRAAMVE